MKRLNFLIALIFSAFCWSCSPSNQIPMEFEVELTIDGMSCEHSCAPAIQEKLMKTEGVINAKVSFETKKAVVTYDSNIIEVDDLKSSVESIGEGWYKVIKSSVPVQKSFIKG